MRIAGDFGALFTFANALFLEDSLINIPRPSYQARICKETTSENPHPLAARARQARFPPDESPTPHAVASPPLPPRPPDRPPGIHVKRDIGAANSA